MGELGLKSCLLLTCRAMRCALPSGKGTFSNSLKAPCVQTSTLVSLFLGDSPPPNRHLNRCDSALTSFPSCQFGFGGSRERRKGTWDRRSKGEFQKDLYPWRKCFPSNSSGHPLLMESLLRAMLRVHSLKKN